MVEGIFGIQAIWSFLEDAGLLGALMTRIRMSWPILRPPILDALGISDQVERLVRKMLLALITAVLPVSLSPALGHTAGAFM